ncbi:MULTISPECIES: LamG-like jellyroll fold domain-containing protein [unclassified Nonomuraea]|uniref:LamG-like jellyroll fold domain-containing protein n=1 Tax=unclassified Nonomuraea TaxID=2593643 RepID=UPI0033CBBCA8
MLRRLRHALFSVLLITTGLAIVAPPPAQALPGSFQRQVVFSGLTNPTNIEFAPDGRVFVAEKSGLIKVFDSLADTTPAIYADLRTQVHNFWDRGLLGLALHPDFPADPRIYVLYSYDAVPGGSAPRWGTAGASADPCPTPPGATGDGCLITGRLSVLAPSGGSVAETPLITGWCQQHPSHSVGDLAFGPDGMLYASGGDGASFNFADYGQDNLTGSDVTPDNPCGDPPSPVGTALSPPAAEGGALRSQDLRTGGDPAGLNGSIIRIDPDTGAAAPGNPNAGSSDPNAARIIAYGQRNPFRITVRPGTNEIWAGEVGWSTYEEINRIAAPTGPVNNFGWPCYEGPARQGGYDNLNLTLCENLYAAGPAAVTQPYFAWNHSSKPAPNDPCPSGGSSSSGVAFYEGGSYPDAYDGALFFSDFSRSCVWVMTKGANGLPDPATVTTFDSGMPAVEVQTGPGGDLFAVDYTNGQIIRYLYNNIPPTAVIGASATSGNAPLTVNFTSAGSADADGDPLTFRWDLDGDGDYDDSTSATPSHTYAQPGSYVVKLRADDGRGGQGTATVTINVNNTAPTATINSPSPSLTWAVGDTITFSGTGTDAQDGTIPGSRMQWKLIMHHCPSTCHEHEITTFTGTGGSFAPPDHEYPSHLELRLTVTDAHGLTDTKSVLLQPKTVNLTFQTVPAGLQLGFNSEQTVAPFTRTVIVGSHNSVSAPSPQSSGGSSYTLTSWSDGGAATHNVTAPATAATYTATYQQSQVPDGLVAAYGMDAGAGTAVADASGKGNNGTAANTTWSLTGRYGQALSFDGTSSWVTVADSSSLRLTNGMTLEAWVRPSSVTGWRTVLMKEFGADLAYAIMGSGGSGPAAFIYTSSGANAPAASNLPLNTWSHVAATYDGSTLRMFVNGTQVATNPTVGNLRTGTSPLRIGGNSGSGEYFSGLIDEVRVYNKALTAAQITTDMNTPVGQQGPPDTQPPTAPGSLAATGGQGSAQLTWTASTDNVAVTGYTVHRSATAGFTPSGANQVGSTASTSFTDSGVAAGTYYYRVVAFDGSSNTGPPSNEASAVVTQPPTVSGLVAAYGMNAGTGTAVADASGNGNNGTLTAATWTAGRYGQALSFDGTSSWVTVADSSSLRLTNGMTLEAWVRPSSVTGWRTVLMKEFGADLAYAIMGSGGSGPAAFIYTSSGANAPAASNLPLNTWSHVAATYDGSTLRMFVNGTQVATNPTVGNLRTGTSPLRIGGNSGSGDYFSGLIDEVRVYNKALTAAQITTDMNTPVS